MMLLADDPIIPCMERTGYASWMQEEYEEEEYEDEDISCL